MALCSIVSCAQRQEVRTEGVEIPAPIKGESDTEQDGVYGVVQQGDEVSELGGQILRNIKAAQGRTVIPVNGLKGVYNITLFERSNPVKSAKMILK